MHKAGAASLKQSTNGDPADETVPVLDGLSGQEAQADVPTVSLRCRKPKPSILGIKQGTHLVREWNGRTYQVEALEKGFRLDGKTYRSLSAIAKKITGAHWSGPRFFGLDG